MNKEDWNKWIQSLPPNVREDALKGGKTASPVGDAAMLGLTFAGAKAAAAALPAIGKLGKGALNWYNKGRLPNERNIGWRQLAKNDWAQRGRFGSPETGLKGWDFTRGFRPGVSAAQGGMGSGPTPLVRQSLERLGPAGLLIGNAGAAKGQPPPLPPIPGSIQELQVQPFKSKPTHNDIGVGMTDEERIKATAAQQWDTTDRGFNIKEAGHFLKETPKGGVPDYRSKYPQFKRNSEGKRPAYDEFWRQQIDK